VDVEQAIRARRTHKQYGPRPVDEATVRDLATYEQPNQFSEGIIDVVVNGELVLRDGAMTNALPGRPIRGRGYEQQ